MKPGAGCVAALLASVAIVQAPSATPEPAPAPAPAQPQPAPPGLRESGPLAAMGFLAGACWQSPLPGGTQTDSRCIRWFQQGRYLRSRHEIKGSQPPYGGETTYYRDPANGQLRSMGFDALGGIAQGTVRVLPDGAVRIDEQHVGRDGRFLQRIRYARVDVNQIAARIERSDDNGRSWRLINDARYVRNPINW